MKTKHEKTTQVRYLKDMERLELYVPGLFLEHIHHQFEVVRVGDVPRHDGEVMPVQQQFSE